MTFLVKGEHGTTEVIGDCESASEAMELFTKWCGQRVISVECISVTSPDEDMEDAFG